MWLLEYINDLVRLALETVVLLLLLAAIFGAIYVLGNTVTTPTYHSEPYATPTVERVRYYNVHE